MEIKDKKTVQIRICSELISNGFLTRISRSSISDFDKYDLYRAENKIRKYIAYIFTNFIIKA